MRVRLPFLALCATLALPAAALGQNREHQQMFADLRMLQEQVQQLRLAINTLADTVKTVTAKQDEQSAATRKAFADQKLLTDAITDSIRILREKGDDTNVRISTLAHELETMRQATQNLQQSVVQALATVAAGAPPATGDPAAAPTGGGTTPPVTPPSSVQSPQTLYDNAWSDYVSARYELAIQGFQAYLRSFPTSPDAYKAQFNIGESYYNMPGGRYRDAAQAYTQVIETYKNTPWVPDAYYKRGSAYLEQGLKEQARADFQTVLKNFADSTVAPLAKAKLDGIK